MNTIFHVFFMGLFFNFTKENQIFLLDAGRL